MMVCLQRLLFTFCLLVTLMLCFSGDKALAVRKWRAQVKKKCGGPKISATFKTVPPKHKSHGKHHHGPADKRSYHALSTDWPATFSKSWQSHHDSLAPTYHLAANYPRWSAHKLKKFDFGPSLPTGHLPLRRADDFAMEVPAMSTGPLIDMSSFNGVFGGDGFYGADISNALLNSREIPPSMLPQNYKSFMADADYSLWTNRFGLNRRADVENLIFVNPFEAYFA